MSDDAGTSMNLEVVLGRAIQASAEGRHRRAIDLCNLAINRSDDPGVRVRARIERASALAALGDWASVERDTRGFSPVEPVRGQLLRARSLFEIGRLDDALSVLGAALASQDRCAAAWELGSRILAKQGRRDLTLEWARRAHALEPSASTTKALARALAAAGAHEQAICLIQSSLDAGSTDAELLVMLGMSAYSLGRCEEAVRVLRDALRLEPESVDAHCALGWVLFRLGHYREGFEHHEYRAGNAGNQRRFGVPPWRGETLAGRRLVICAEQGFGDTIQFARFVPRVRALTEQTQLFVAPPLARLLSSVPGIGPLECGRPGMGSADFQTLLMSLPHLLRLEHEASATLPCLYPEPERLAQWRARLPPGPKIALSWQGNPKYGGEPWRSMPFAEFEPLVQRFASEATLLSVQKHVGREQLRAAPFRDRVVDLGDSIDADGHAFLDSLAILSLVDAFVTTDSALAHVAGSAGIAADVLLSYAADWRWGTAAERTPWYPCLRLARQAAPGDWGSAMSRVLHSVEERVLGRGMSVGGASRTPRADINA